MTQKLLLGELYFQLKQQKFTTSEATHFSMAIINSTNNEINVDMLSRLSVALQQVVVINSTPNEL